MSKKISLTIAERYDIVKYAHQIPSSMATYFTLPFNEKKFMSKGTL